MVILEALVQSLDLVVELIVMVTSESSMPARKTASKAEDQVKRRPEERSHRGAV